MNLRVSLQTMVNQSLYYEQQQTTAMSLLQQQESSGNRIVSPDVDPLGDVAVINYNTQDAADTTDLTNINTATNALNVSVSTLTSANSVITQAKQLAIEATNSGNDSTSLNALGTQVNELLTQLTNDANTQNNGEYIFSGTKTGTQPFVTDSSGNVSYAGSSQSATIPVGSSQTVQTYAPGSSIFMPPGSGSQSAFQVLQTLRDNMLNTQGVSSSAQMQAISNSLGSLTQVSNNILGVVGEQSATLQNLSVVQSQVSNVQLQTKTLASNLSSADIASVATNLQAQQNLLQATLEVTSQMFSTSLVNFLK